MALERLKIQCLIVEFLFLIGNETGVKGIFYWLGSQLDVCSQDPLSCDVTFRRASITGRGRRREINAVNSNTINPQTGVSVNVGMSEHMGLLIPGQKRQGFEVAPSDVYPNKVSRIGRREGENTEIVFPSSTELRVDRTMILPEAPRPGQVQILATSKQSPQAFEKDGHTRDSHWLFQI